MNRVWWQKLWPALSLSSSSYTSELLKNRKKKKKGNYSNENVGVLLIDVEKGIDKENEKEKINETI